MSKESISSRIIAIAVMSLFGIKAITKISKYISNDVYPLAFYLYALLFLISIGAVVFFSKELFKTLKKADS